MQIFVFVVSDVCRRAVLVRHFGGNEIFHIVCAEFFGVGDFLRGMFNFDFAVQAVLGTELFDRWSKR